MSYQHEPQASNEDSAISSTNHARVPPPVMNRRISHVSITSEGDVDPSEGAEDCRFRALPRQKIFIIITFSLVNFCLGAFYSLLGPFFPNEAAKQGVSNVMMGLIFGVFELILVIMSPIFGNFITQIGAKFMYCTGILVCGSSAILFGFLDQSPPGTIYIVMCFLVRSIEGLGAAAFVTASFAIMAHTFPKNISSMFGMLELFTGLGLMAGPPIGGALFQWGGFRLPFATSGALMVVVGIISVVLLPTISDLTAPQGSFILGLFRIPVVCIMGLCLISGAACIGFFDVGLSIYLEGIYHFRPITIGLVFLVMPGVYAITAPIWGITADKLPRLSSGILIVGYILAGLSLFFVGPAPFLPIASDHLWLLLVSLAVGGFGIGTLVIAFQIIMDGTREYGYPDSLETYGIISGLFNSFFSFGAFLGPLIGGYLIDKLKFPLASVCIGSTSIAVAVLYLFYCIYDNNRRVKRNQHMTDPSAGQSSSNKGEDSETSPLISDCHVTRSYDVLT